MSEFLDPEDIGTGVDRVGGVRVEGVRDEGWASPLADIALVADAVVGRESRSKTDCPPFLVESVRVALEGRGLFEGVCVGVFCDCLGVLGLISMSVTGGLSVFSTVTSLGTICSGAEIFFGCTATSLGTLSVGFFSFDLTSISSGGVGASTLATEVLACSGLEGGGSRFVSSMSPT